MHVHVHIHVHVHRYMPSVCSTSYIDVDGGSRELVAVGRLDSFQNLILSEKWLLSLRVRSCGCGSGRSIPLLLSLDVRDQSDHLNITYMYACTYIVHTVWTYDIIQKKHQPYLVWQITKIGRNQILNLVICITHNYSPMQKLPKFDCQSHHIFWLCIHVYNVSVMGQVGS